MEREIKFRGKTNTLHYVGAEIKAMNNIWVYGYLVFENQRYKIQDDDSGIYLPVNSDTIGQFTGLTDKNGVEIYEGDIIRFSYLYEEYTDACFLYDVEPQYNRSIDIVHLDEQKGIVEYNQDKFILRTFATYFHSLFRGDMLFQRVLDRASILCEDDIITFLGDDMELGYEIANSFIENEVNREEILFDAINSIEKYEVIGNIYDNPELLTDKTK